MDSRFRGNQGGFSFFGDVPQRLRWLDIQCGRLLNIKVVEHG
jgi:hypothetical protein